MGEDTDVEEENMEEVETWEKPDPGNRTVKFHLNGDSTDTKWPMEIDATTPPRKRRIYSGYPDIK